MLLVRLEMGRTDITSNSLSLSFFFSSEIVAKLTGNRCFEEFEKNDSHTEEILEGV